MDEGNLEKKNVKHKFDELYKIWLGLVNLFQTFEELDGVKDKVPISIQPIQ